MIGLAIIAIALWGDVGEPTVVWASDPEPETRLERAQTNLARYGSYCLANDLASSAVRQQMGLTQTPDPYATFRTRAAALALENSRWGYTRIALTTVTRAVEMLPAMAYLIPILDADGNPTDETLLAPLLQAQSDCQEATRARIIIENELELAALSGITAVDGLLQCAAVSLERAEREPPEALRQLADDLKALARAHGRTNLDPDADIQNRRDVFLTQFFRDETSADGSYSDLLTPHLTQCDRIVAELRIAGHLPP